MNDKMTWSIMLQPTSERSYRMRAPVLVAAVVTVHALAIGAVTFIQGCGTTPRKPVAVEPPPAPVMPPRQETMAPPQRVFQPAVPIEPAPSMAVPSEGKTYVVQNGDSLSKIAARCGVGSRELAELNNIKDANKIRIGQKLLLPDYAKPQPVSKSKPKSTGAAKPKAEAAAPVTGGTEYVVQAGDSLSRIAYRNGVKISALREANPNLKGDKILVGQKLVIPGGAGPAAPSEVLAPAPVAEGMMAPPPPMEMTPVPMPGDPAASAVAPAEPMSVPQGQPMDYSVQDGDSLDAIARMFMVSKEDLMRVNGITDESTVQPGMKIKIPTSSP